MIPAIRAFKVMDAAPPSLPESAPRFLEAGLPLLNRAGVGLEFRGLPGIGVGVFAEGGARDFKWSWVFNAGAPAFRMQFKR